SAAAEPGIADPLADGPQPHETLATRTAPHAPSLRRVLRLLATARVFAEGADGRFELTPVGSSLRSAPGSFRATARLFGGPMVWRGWGDLLETVRTGEPAFTRVLGTDSFGYFAEHPHAVAAFCEAMRTFTTLLSRSAAV